MKKNELKNWQVVQFRNGQNAMRTKNKTGDCFSWDAEKCWYGLPLEDYSDELLYVANYMETAENYDVMKIGNIKVITKPIQQVLPEILKDINSSDDNVEWIWTRQETIVQQ